MKNGDKPAMPIFNDGGFVSSPDGRALVGLTKREQFAMAAMQGLLSGGYCINDPHYRINDTTSEAVSLADALLAALAKADGDI